MQQYEVLQEIQNVHSVRHAALMLHSAVLVITVYSNLQLVSTSRMRSVMLTYIPPERRPKTTGMHVSMGQMSVIYR